MNVMSRKDRELTETCLPWHTVEEAIDREVEWLRQVIVQHIIREKDFHQLPSG